MSTSHYKKPAIQLLKIKIRYFPFVHYQTGISPMPKQYANFENFQRPRKLEVTYSNLSKRHQWRCWKSYESIAISQRNRFNTKLWLKTFYCSPPPFTTAIRPHPPIGIYRRKSGPVQRPINSENSHNPLRWLRADVPKLLKILLFPYKCLTTRILKSEK